MGVCGEFCAVKILSRNRIVICHMLLFFLYTIKYKYFIPIYMEKTAKKNTLNTATKQYTIYVDFFLKMLYMCSFVYINKYTHTNDLVWKIISFWIVKFMCSTKAPNTRVHKGKLRICSSILSDVKSQSNRRIHDGRRLH